MIFNVAGIILLLVKDGSTEALLFYQMKKYRYWKKESEKI